MFVDPHYSPIDSLQMGLSSHDSPGKALTVLGMTMTRYEFTYQGRYVVLQPCNILCVC